MPITRLKAWPKSVRPEGAPAGKPAAAKKPAATKTAAAKKGAPAAAEPHASETATE